MSHQRYLSHDPIKEPHSVSVKVLRYVQPNHDEGPGLSIPLLTRRTKSLSRPSLVSQYPIEPPFSPPSVAPGALPASLSYSSTKDTNPSPFLLSPIVNLPISFGSAYVGETFSCTLCANNDLPPSSADGPSTKKNIRDVRIEAEMKTPGAGQAQPLDLKPETPGDTTDLDPGATLQKIVSFDLKEEGNHVLAVTVSYYEASETSGRTRTFRKLYQFICKASLIVRTKVGPLPVFTDQESADSTTETKAWILEAQLENCSDETMQLQRVVMELDSGFSYRDCNWESTRSDKPVLHSGEVEQVCFVVQQQDKAAVDAATSPDGRVAFGVLGIGWRGEMGNRGFLSTGKLGTRITK